MNWLTKLFAGKELRVLESRIEAKGDTIHNKNVEIGAMDSRVKSLSANLESRIKERVETQALIEGLRADKKSLLDSSATEREAHDATKVLLRESDAYCYGKTLELKQAQHEAEGLSTKLIDAEIEISGLKGLTGKLFQARHDLTSAQGLLDAANQATGELDARVKQLKDAATMTVEAHQKLNGQLLTKVAELDAQVERLAVHVKNGCPERLAVQHNNIARLEAERDDLVTRLAEAEKNDGRDPKTGRFASRPNRGTGQSTNRGN